MSAQLNLRESKPVGEAIAAFFSPVVGLFALSIANMLEESNQAYYRAMYLQIGSWIPGYDKIGPYTGKETILLVAWLGTWIVLHLILRKRNPPIAPWAIAFVVGIATAALLLWPPLRVALTPE